MVGPLFKSALWHAATLLFAWAGLPALFDDPAAVDAVVVVEMVTVAERRNLPNAAAASAPLPAAPPPAPGADPAPVEVAALAPSVAAAAPAPRPEPMRPTAEPPSAPPRPATVRPAAVRAIAPPPPDRAAEAPAPRPAAPRAPTAPQPPPPQAAAAHTDDPPRPTRAADAPDPAPARAEDDAAEPDRPEPEAVAALAEPAPPAPPPRPALSPEDVRRPARKPPPPRPDDDFERALDRALERIDEPEPTVASRPADETAAPTAESDPIARLLASDDAAVPLDERLTMTEVDAIRAQIQRNWSVPAGAEGAHEMTVTLRVRLEADGRTVRSVFVEDRARAREDPFFRAMADSAVRAVNRTERLESLSPETYRKLRDRPDIVLRFNPRDMFDE